jgi:acyl-ACP thioesterase
MTDNLVQFTKTLIDTSNTDAESRLRLSGLANILVQAAIQSADQLGFGFKDLEQQQLVWVLSRLNIEIYKPLKWYDTAEVETWPKNIERLLYVRDFIVRNQYNEVVAKATSAWLAIDIRSRRPKVMNKEQMEKFTRLRDKHAIMELPEKLNPVKGNSIFTQIPTYYDIDLNKHVTSVRYIDWIMDTFDMEYLNKNYPKNLCINYLKETLPGEAIEVITASNGSDFQFEGNNKKQECVAFRAKLNF